MLGLEVRAQLDVAQVAVVGEPRVVRVGDLDQRCHVGPLAHGEKCCGCATATTSPTTMIAGRAYGVPVEVGAERRRGW